MKESISPANKELIRRKLQEVGGKPQSVILKPETAINENTHLPKKGNHKEENKNKAAVELGRLGGLKGGKARAKKLSSEERTESARNAANARWGKKRKLPGNLFNYTINKAPKEDLHNAYVVEKLSHRDCCKRFKVSKNTLKKLLIYYEIPSRDISESMKIIHDKNPNHGSKGQFKSTDSNAQTQRKKKAIKSQHISCGDCAYWEFIDDKMGICHATPPLRRDNYDLTVDLEMGEKEEWMGYGKWFCTNSYDWCRLWTERPIKKSKKFFINQGF